MNVQTLAEQITENGGFTLDPVTGRTLVVGTDTGWAIALPGTERLIGENLTENAFGEALSDVLASIPADDRENVKVGGWYSPERGYMIELTTVLHVDRGTAELIGDIRNQDAIFNLATGEEIFIHRAPVSA